MFGSGWRSTNHVVPFQNSLLAAHKGVRKGTLINDSARPEENDIRRRFLSDEGAAFTLLFRFENRRARKRSERARERDVLVLIVNKSHAVFIFIRENRRSKRK